MANALARMVKRLPFLRDFFDERDWLRTQYEQVKPYLSWVPPGHFYSPWPALADIQAAEGRLFGPVPKTLPAIDLRAQQQLRLLSELGAFAADQPFKPEKTPPMRYYLHNEWFSYFDGLVLHAMMRHLRPKRIIEIGSGFSSAVMLDTRELFLDRSLSLTFIDPNPERLMSLLTDADREHARIVPKRLQELDYTIFGELEAGDILFIDSSHTSKIDSDVNHLMFTILPALNRDVYVHIHDVFYPFEYPREWVLERGWFWNEAYLVRAFLQYNSAFEIAFFNSYLQQCHRGDVQARMPLCLNSDGQSLWLRKAASPVA